MTRREAREKEISVLKTKFERYFDRIGLIFLIVLLFLNAGDFVCFLCFLVGSGFLITKEKTTTTTVNKLITHKDRRNHGGGKKSDGNLDGEEINEV